MKIYEIIPYVCNLMDIKIKDIIFSRKPVYWHYNNAIGVYYVKKKFIWIYINLSAEEKRATLIHELAHAFINQKVKRHKIVSLKNQRIYKVDETWCPTHGHEFKEVEGFIKKAIIKSASK